MELTIFHKILLLHLIGCDSCNYSNKISLKPLSPLHSYCEIFHNSNNRYYCLFGGYPVHVKTSLKTEAKDYLK